MENEKEIKNNNTNKLLIAIIILTSINLLIGIINIGFVLKNNFKSRNFKMPMRQEEMFRGSNFNNYGIMPHCTMRRFGNNRRHSMQNKMYFNYDNMPNLNNPRQNFSNSYQDGNITRNQIPKDNRQNNYWQKDVRSNNEILKPENNIPQNGIPQNLKPENYIPQNGIPQNFKPEFDNNFNSPK